MMRFGRFPLCPYVRKRADAVLGKPYARGIIGSDPQAPVAERPIVLPLSQEGAAHGLAIVHLPDNTSPGVHRH
jgi:hypothetical protein